MSSMKIHPTRRRVLRSATAAVSLGVAMPFVLRSIQAAASDPAASDTIAETTLGKIRGTAQGGIHTFKGVRYAASTAGANRFRPPVPAEPWPGIADATKFGSSAPQISESRAPLYAWYTSIQPIDEDCLFLNVFTPGIGDAARRPVMVWLHGGSWQACAGSAPGFDGTHLAAAGDVVVVTLNHRLSAFGYLLLDDKDERFADAGNAGMLDLIVALRWVRANAAIFGGDPSNVTIFGQSGGAAKVLALMGMPAAHGLFHKAVVESCSGGMRIDGREEAEQQAHLLAASLGVERLQGAELQKMPVERLLNVMKTVADPFRPVIDGRNFERDPFYPAAPIQSSQVPLLIGNAATETTYYLAVDPANFSLDAAEVHRRLARFLRVDGAQIASLVDAYSAQSPSASPSQLLTTVTTDYVFRRNTMRAAGLQAAQGQAPVYYYVFNWRTPVMGGVLMTPHTSEVPFVFGTTDAASAMIGTGADLSSMSRIMMATWSAFARGGNPNNTSLPAWPDYATGNKPAMMLGLESEVASDPGGEARRSLDELTYYEYSMPRAAFMHP
jgi:para-nitrobenzyl esterase